MPELPEVETVKRGLEPYVRGASIQSCQLRRKNLRFEFSSNFEKRITGSVIEDIQRRGKFMTVLFSNGEALIWHLGMSGQVKIFENKNEFFKFKS